MKKAREEQSAMEKGRELFNAFLSQYSATYADSIDWEEFKNRPMPFKMKFDDANDLYQQFTFTHSFFTSVLADLENNYKSLSSAFLYFYGLVAKIQNAQKSYDNLAKNMPRIITQEEYDKGLEEAKRLKENRQYSLFDLVEYAIDEACNKIGKGEAHFLKSFYSKRKAPKAFNEAIKQYGLDLIAQKIGRNIGDFGGNCFSSEDYNTPSFRLTSQEGLEVIGKGKVAREAFNGSLKQLAKAWPNLISAITEEFSLLDGLGFLSNLKEEDYDKEDLIPKEIALRLNILNAHKELTEDYIIHRGYRVELPCAIAPMSEPYYYPVMNTEGTPELLIYNDHFIEDVRSTIDVAISSCENVYKCNYMIEVVARILNMPELSVLVRNGVEGLVKNIQLIALSTEIKRMGIYRQEKDQQKMIYQYREVFNIPLPKEFPTKDIIEKVEDIFPNEGDSVKLGCTVFNLAQIIL